MLTGTRKGSHGEGERSIPGGHLEYGETFKDVCYRELEEETGVTRAMVENFPFEHYGFSEDFYDEKHYVTLYFIIDIGKNVLPIENREPDKCEGWEWRALTDVPQKMFCHTTEVLEKLAREKGYAKKH